MKNCGQTLNLVVFSIALLWAAQSHAGEALITKARSGGRLLIDQGAEAGLVVGTEVTIVRPPREAIIHPRTGENLGSPELRIGTGEITKTSARSATVKLQHSPLLAVQPGDIVRFITPEEEMIMDQEQSMARNEKAQEERQQLRTSVSELTRNIRKSQGTIGDLRSAIKRLDRIDESIKVQLRSINEDIIAMKEDIVALRETVNLMGAIPVSEEGEAASTWIEEEENIERLQGIIRDVIQEELPNVQPGAMPVAGEEEDLDDLGEEEEGEGEGEGEANPFYQQLWFYGVIAGVGLLAVLVWLYMKMNADDEEDEDEEDEDEEDEDEDEDYEIEEEEDIVVEETA